MRKVGFDIMRPTGDIECKMDRGKYYITSIKSLRKWMVEKALGEIKDRTFSKIYKGQEMYSF